MKRIFDFVKEYATFIVPIIYSLAFLLVYVHQGSFNDYFGLKYQYISPNISLILTYGIVCLPILLTYISLIGMLLFFPSFKSLKNTWWIRCLILTGTFHAIDYYFFDLPFMWEELLSEYSGLMIITYLIIDIAKRRRLRSWIKNLKLDIGITKTQFKEQFSFQKILFKSTLYSPISVIIAIGFLYSIYKYAYLLGDKQAKEQTTFQVLKNKPWMFLINEYDGTYYFKSYTSKKGFGDSLLILKVDEVELFKKEIKRFDKKSIETKL